MIILLLLSEEILDVVSDDIKKGFGFKGLHHYPPLQNFIFNF